MKKIKIPKLFKKKFTSDSFEKKILKKIHIPADREFLKSIFVETEDGKLEPRKDLSKSDLSKMVSLAKSIKKNKGMITVWKGGIVLFLFVIVLGFNLFFKDQLLTNGIETGLETVFQGKTEVKGLHFSLIKGIVSYQSLSIADADNSSRNLIETGPAEFNLDIGSLINKRIKIEKISLTDFRWSTPRIGESDEPGISANGVNNDKSKSKGIKTDLYPGKDDIDIKNLIEENRDSIKSLQLLNEGNEEIRKTLDKWENIYSEKNKEIESLSEEVESLRSISINKISSVSEGTQVLNQISDLYSHIEKTKSDLISLQAEFEADREQFMDTAGAVKSAVTEDVDMLAGLLDLSTGDGRSIVSSVVKNYIENRWSGYYNYGQKALHIYDRIQDRKQDELEDEKGFQRDKGRDFVFSGSGDPDFVIEQISISGGDEASGKIAADIKYLSSEPEKLDKPLEFTLELKSKTSSINLNGFLDNRLKSENDFVMEISSPSNFISLEEGVPSLEIDKFSSISDIKGISKLSDKEDGVLTTLTVSMRNIEIDQGSQDGFVSEIIANIIDSLDSVDLEVEILATMKGLSEIKVDSNIDELISERMGEYFETIADEKKSELESELLNYISPALEDNKLLQSSLTDMGVESMDQISSLDDIQKVLDLKKDAVQKEMKSGVQEEASNLLDQAAEKIKLPGF